MAPATDALASQAISGAHNLSVAAKDLGSFATVANPTRVCSSVG